MNDVKMVGLIICTLVVVLLIIGGGIAVVDCTVRDKARYECQCDHQETGEDVN